MGRRRPRAADSIVQPDDPCFHSVRWPATSRAQEPGPGTGPRGQGMALDAHREGLGRGVVAVAFLATLPASIAAAAQPPAEYPGRPKLRVVYEITPNPPRTLGVGSAIEREERKSTSQTY